MHGHRAAAVVGIGAILGFIFGIAVEYLLSLDEDKAEPSYFEVECDRWGNYPYDCHDERTRNP